MRVMNQRAAVAALATSRSARCCSPNYRGFLRQVAHLPAAGRRAWPASCSATSASSRRSTSPRASRAGCPAGIYTGAGIEHYVAEVLSDPDRTNDFRLLDHELYLTATDLDTTERVVLGEGEWADVPISTAVAASGALPMVYEPVEINGREFIDGGIRSTTNVDVAVEHGAKFIVVINPLVPYVNDFRKRIPTITGTRARRVSDMGFTAIGNQAFRLLSHERLHLAVAVLGGALPRASTSS